MKLKEVWKKFWFIVWKDDSLKGWIFSLIFLFVLIKFIFLPGLGFVTGTSLPLAIVESCSMYHSHNPLYPFGEWWQDHEEKYEKFTINNLDFKEFSLTNGFNKGDILFIIKAEPEKIKIGDVIIFNAGQKNPLIHRIIKIEKTNNKYFFSTIGDNNNGQLPVEKKISEEQLVGKAVLKIVPYAGWGKLIAVDIWNKILSQGNFNYIKEGFCNQN